jgi:hypothetical protein
MREPAAPKGKIPPKRHGADQKARRVGLGKDPYAEHKAREAWQASFKTLPKEDKHAHRRFGGLGIERKEREKWWGEAKIVPDSNCRSMTTIHSYCRVLSSSQAGI